MIVANDASHRREGQSVLCGMQLEKPYILRIVPLHDGYDSDFNWQRDYLVGRNDEERRRYHPTRDSWGPLRVPMDKYFVLGDNRDNSADSRYWGFVDASAVKGRPLVVYFSYDRGTRHALPWLTDLRLSRLGSLIH